MRRSHRFALVSVGLLAFGGLSAGCNRDEPIEESPAEAARQAVGVNNEEDAKTEKTTAVSRDVIVKKTTEVTDAKTGEILSTEKEVTPVSVQQEKKVDTDVKVNVGDTTKTVD